jgi:hypothetical protein
MLRIRVKQLYRLFVSLSSLAYVIYYARKDLLNCLIVPSGQVQLALMWGLHGRHIGFVLDNVTVYLHVVLHLLGLGIYVALTIYSNWNKSSEAMTRLQFHPHSYWSGIVILSTFIFVPILLHLIGIFIHLLFGILMFMIWTLIFHQTWAPTPTAGEVDEEPAPAHEDTNDRTRPHEAETNVDPTLSDSQTNLEYLSCSSVCSFFWRGPLDRYYE